MRCIYRRNDWGRRNRLRLRFCPAYVERYLVGICLEEITPA
jgi:hypothetical protein